MTSISHSESWYIYALRAGDSEYRYVGYTTKKDPQKRLKQHFHDCTRFSWPIYHWLSKQDPDNVFLDVLEVCPKGDRDHLYTRETFWIEYYRDLQGSLQDQRTDTYLLNILSGGGGRVGMKHSEEAKAKMSAAHSGKIISPETRQKMSESQKGRMAVFTEEHRKKLSDAKIGNKQSHYALHVRHHVNKDKTKEGCTHCPDLTTEPEETILMNVGSQ